MPRRKNSAHQRERHPVMVRGSRCTSVPSPNLLANSAKLAMVAGIEHPAEHAEHEAAAVGSEVAEQAQVGAQPPPAPGASSPRRAAGQRVVQGLPAGSSLTVAMLSSAKPSRPSTSMAVITDWCVARASARSVTAHAAVGAGLLQQRRAQRLGAGVDELVLVDEVAARLRDAHHQRLAAAAFGGHGARPAAGARACVPRP